MLNGQHCIEKSFVDLAGCVKHETFLHYNFQRKENFFDWNIIKDRPVGDFEFSLLAPESGNLIREIELSTREGFWSKNRMKYITRKFRYKSKLKCLFCNKNRIFTLLYILCWDTIYLLVNYLTLILWLKCKFTVETTNSNFKFGKNILLISYLIVWNQTILQIKKNIVDKIVLQLRKGSLNMLVNLSFTA